MSIAARIAVALAVTAAAVAFAQDEPAAAPTSQPASQPSTQPATQPTLKVGDAAPALNVDHWVKGTPVASFEPGKIYVLDFWATWCGPCTKSAPDLSMLQAKYPKMVFIGVNVKEKNAANTEPFVRRMGAKMDYRIAADISPGDLVGGPMWDAWMAAAGEKGIPCAFVVDGEGKILAITHPGMLAPKLRAIEAGTYDAAADAQASAKQDELLRRYGKAMKKKDFTEAKIVFDELVKSNPIESPDDYATEKLSLLIDSGDFAAAETQYDAILRAGEHGDMLPSDVGQARFDRLELLRARGDVAALNQHIVDLRTLYADNADDLNALAWTLVDGPANQGFRAMAVDMDLVLKIANDANIASTGENAMVLDTLARVHAVRGEFELAARTEKLALDITKSPTLRMHFAKSLTAYKASREE